MDPGSQSLGSSDILTLCLARMYALLPGTCGAWAKRLGPFLVQAQRYSTVRVRHGRARGRYHKKCCCLGPLRCEILSYNDLQS